MDRGARRRIDLGGWGAGDCCVSGVDVAGTGGLAYLGAAGGVLGGEAFRAPYLRSAGLMRSGALGSPSSESCPTVIKKKRILCLKTM